MRASPVRPEKSARFRRLAACATLAGGALALSSGCKEEEKANFRLNVVFPSTELAIATTEVKFVVFDDPEDGACQRIYLKHITNQTDLPPVVLDPAPVAMCDVALGRGGAFEIPVGKHSILAVASRENEDLLVGCSDVALGSDGGEISVTLALPGITPLPPLSKCLSVTEFCTGACQQ